MLLQNGNGFLEAAEIEKGLFGVHIDNRSITPPRSNRGSVPARFAGSSDTFGLAANTVAPHASSTTTALEATNNRTTVVPALSSSPRDVLASSSVTTTDLGEPIIVNAGTILGALWFARVLSPTATASTVVVAWEIVPSTKETRNP